MTNSTTAASDIETLGARFSGDLILSDHSDYDEARHLFNKLHDNRPALIARCVGTSDVVEAVRYARAHELEIAIRSGGRHMAGFASSDGGLVIELSAMRGVKVDRREQTAWVQAGCNSGDVLAETLAYGLGAVTGLAPTVGIGGFILHGGFGCLSPRMGWGVDTILELELVTADGEVLRVAPDEHPDLFWAVRGAGSNFGVVTWMKLQLSRVPEAVLAGALIYDGDQAAAVFRFLREFSLHASDDVTIIPELFVAPSEEWLPKDLHGKLALSLTTFHLGELTRAEEELRPLLEAHPPAVADLAPRGILDFEREIDAAFPSTRQWFDDEHVAELSDDAIDIVVAQAGALAEGGLGASSTLIVYPFAGAAAREPALANAFPRDGRGGWSIGPALFWEDEADDARHKEFSDAVVAAIRDAGLATGRVYSNVQQVPDERRLRVSFGEENWKRLTEVKAQYDPENLFHRNHNIPPAS